MSPTQSASKQQQPGSPSSAPSRSSGSGTGAVAGGRVRPRVAPRGTGSYQRKRAVSACQVCRARRTKCDNLKPSCSFCLKVGATCIQADAGLSTFDPASIRILERLDVLESLLRTPEGDDRAESQGRNQVQTYAQQQYDARSSPSRLSAAGHAAQPSPSSSSAPAAHDTPVNMGMLFPMTLDQLMAWTCFESLFTPDDLHEEPCLPSLHLSTSGASYRHDPLATHDASVSMIVSTDLEPAHVRKLVDKFFRYVHITNPIFDEPHIRTVVESTAINGIDWSPNSCLSLLICALGTMAGSFASSQAGLCPVTDTDTRARAYAYFRAAEKRLGSLLTSYNIVAPQCLILAGNFMMSHMEAIPAWRFFVQALAQCQQLKLYEPSSLMVQRRGQDQRHSEDNDEVLYLPVQSEADSLHQAVYWSAWKSERDMRRFLRTPDFGKNDHSTGLYPAFFPSPPPPREAALDDTMMHLGDLAGADHGEQRQEKAWYFYLAEISLRRLIARHEADIERLSKAHGASRQGFLAAAALLVPAYESQVQQWIDSLPNGISFSVPVEEDDVCRFVLRGFATSLMDRIYWPFLEAHLNNDDGLQVTMMSSNRHWLAPYAELAQKGLDQQQHRIVVNSPGFMYRHQGTYAMALGCARSALVLIAASLQGPLGLVLPSGWERQVDEVVNLLRTWGQESRFLAEASHVLHKAVARSRGT